MRESSAGLWSMFEKGTIGPDEKLAVACYEELYAATGPDWVRFSLLWSSGTGTGLGVLLMLYIFAITLHPTWTFLSTHLLRDVFWWIYPLLMAPLLWLARNRYSRFGKKAFKSMQEETLRKYFPESASLERLRDKWFDGKIPEMSPFFFPHQNYAIKELVKRLGMLIGTTAVAVLYSVAGPLKNGIVAFFSFTAIFVLVFIGMEVLRAFWNWRIHPKIPIAAVLLNANELIEFHQNFHG